MRLTSPQGRIVHAALRIGDSMVMLAEPKSLGGTPVTLHLQVADADSLFAHAVTAGATVDYRSKTCSGEQYDRMKRFGADLQARGLLMASEALHSTAEDTRPSSTARSPR